MTHSYQQLLTDFAEHIGVDCSNLLVQQEICIAGLSIFMQQSGDEAAPGLVLCSILGKPAPQRFTQVMQAVLQANHLWVGTAGGTLGLSPAGDAITWCLRLPMHELDGAKLAALIAGFTQLGQAWMQYIAGGADETAVAPTQAFPLGMRV